MDNHGVHDHRLMGDGRLVVTLPFCPSCGNKKEVKAEVGGVNGRTILLLPDALPMVPPAGHTQNTCRTCGCMTGYYREAHSVGEMRIWHIFVGNGRFLVRAKTEEDAIDMARKEAANYLPKTYDASKEPSGLQTIIDLDGDPKVLDIDYS